MRAIRFAKSFFMKTPCKYTVVNMIHYFAQKPNSFCKKFMVIFGYCDILVITELIKCLHLI